MRRFVMTGAPGSGKTSVLMALQQKGYDVVAEAATAVIAKEQAAGTDEPWAHPTFIDAIVDLQRQGQLDAARSDSTVQLYDRSPVCTLALSTYLGYPASAALTAELDRITGDHIYDRRVFFIRDLGFCTPTAARRITFEDALEFGRIHEQTYRALGYQLIDVPRGAVATRADTIDAYVATWLGNRRGSPS